jgi:hypothetical protein
MQHRMRILILDVPVSTHMQKYISLVSIVQSQPTHTPSTRNQATGFSSKAIIRPMTETMKNKLHTFCKRKTSHFFTTTCIKCVSIYKNVLPKRSVP